PRSPRRRRARRLLRPADVPPRPLPLARRALRAHRPFDAAPRLGLPPRPAVAAPRAASDRHELPAPRRARALRRARETSREVRRADARRRRALAVQAG